MMNNLTSPLPPASDDTSLTDLGMNIVKYTVPVIIPFGLIGNISTVLTIQSSRSIRRLSTGVYLTALTLADLSSLVIMITVWRSSPGGTPIHSLHNDLHCKTVALFNMFIYMWSSWMVIAVTVDRVMIVFFPATKFSTRKVAIGMVIVITVCLMTIALGFAFQWGVQVTKKCQDPEIYTKLRTANQRAGLFTFVTLAMFFPILMLFFLNIILIIKLTQLRLELRKLQDAASDHTRKAQELSITVLVMSVTFTLLMLPVALIGHLILVLNFALPAHQQINADHAGFAYQMVRLLLNVNHCINFYLYVLSSKSMRRVYVCFCRQCFCC
jgi:hypothetical protein